MKLKHSLQLNINLELCHGGIIVTLPVDSTIELGNFGVQIEPKFINQKFIVTNKVKLVDLIIEKIEELYETKDNV